MNLQFSTKMANLRKGLQYTQDQVAQFVGVSKAAVSKWEKGLSYPDIALLPKLATFFSTTIDDLLGYEPQMTLDQIRKTYARLANDFNTKPYQEVEEEINRLIEEYYSCNPFIFQMAVLLGNYSNISANPTETMHRVLKICDRIKNSSEDYQYVYKANMLGAQIYLMLQQPEEVLRIVGEKVEIYYGSEMLMASAYTLLSKPDEAMETLQISQYQHVIGLFSSATETLHLHLDKPALFEETVRRLHTMIELFNLSKLNVNCALVFYFKAASGYMLLQNEEKALEMLHYYGRACAEIEFPIALHGDDYFYRIERWITATLDLGNMAPRDDASIKRDLIATIVEQPLFQSLHDRKEFKAIVMNLEHHLR